MQHRLSLRTILPTIRRVTSKDSDHPLHPSSTARVFVHPSLDSWEAVEGTSNQQKIIRLRGYAGWSESFLVAWVFFEVLSCAGSFTGFQAGPTFPTIPTFPYFFCVPTFPYFFLKMPYYPYFLVQKCLKWPKIAIFFLARSKFVKIGST